MTKIITNCGRNMEIVKRIISIVIYRKKKAEKTNIKSGFDKSGLERGASGRPVRK